MAKFDPILSEHVRRVQSGDLQRVHYLGKETQNEFIDILGNAIFKEISRRVVAAKYYSIILDCTSDISHEEQMTAVVRFVTVSKNTVEICEHFIGFVVVDDTTGKGLYETLLDILKSNNLELNNCRGQGYDNGSNMKGKNRGVQARILKDNKRAFFVSCSCHNLNLVVSDAGHSSVTAELFFGVLQRLFAVFAASTQRLVVWYDVLQVINKISKALQCPKVDLHTAMNMIDGALLQLQTFRESGFETCIATAKKMAEKLDISQTLPESRTPRTRRFFDYESQHDERPSDPMKSIIRNSDNFMRLDRTQILTKSKALENYLTGEDENSDIDGRELAEELESLKAYFVAAGMTDLSALVMISHIIDKGARFSRLARDQPWASAGTVDVTDATDIFWHKLGNCSENDQVGHSYHNLSKFALDVISLPHSNAECERKFSAVNLIKTKTRNKLITPTVNGLLLAGQRVKKNCVTLEPLADEYKRMNNNTLYLRSIPKATATASNTNVDESELSEDDFRMPE
ncbi:uncharacterized protein LOC124293018 [Neodiprion lecontei]|uniref:Uncharacterized protein LOC124293018 n=1 Tax=Neodiprion lecontei TaxID=441921 RepID=A0ABM3FIM7_NEOLC|nr:uncharacterized protein LOC124293018 [Neodiprion lecontei]